MDYRLRLNELILEYQVDRHIPMFRQGLEAIAVAKDLYNEKKDFEKVILVGTAATDLKWYNSEICGNRLETFLFDDLDKPEVPGDFADRQALFLNTSYENRFELVGRLKESGLRVIDIYDEFEKRGLYFYGNFYDVYQESYRKFRNGEASRDVSDFDMNRIFFMHRRRFELETDEELKRKYLEILIFDCAYAKDFLMLKRYVDIYRQKFGGAEAEYVQFYNDVEALLQEIKRELSARKQKDCIMHWIDALEYGDDKDMPFLQGVRDRALWFENIYTVTPYTGATLKTLFAKRRVVEDESFKLEKIGIRNSELIASMKERGYRFLYYGSHSEFSEENRPNYFYTVYSSLSQIYWDVICDILFSEECLFCVLHELLQTHLPYISMGLTGNRYQYVQAMPGRQEDASIRKLQQLESKKYVDDQLAFWAELLPKQMYKIYMSDHGHTRLGRYHAIMNILQRDIRPAAIRGLVSYYNFDKILLAVLDGREVREEDISEKYVLIQDVDYYNGECIPIFLKDKNYSEAGLIGYQGVITEDELFIRYKDGVEVYQKHINDERMVTDKRLKELRELVSSKVINVYEEEKFKYTRLIYDALYRCRARTGDAMEKRKEIIRGLFGDIPKTDALAVRGGGMNSLRLLMLLPEEERCKVRYIIDRDKECLAGKLGIKVILPEECHQYKVDCIIISTFDYREAFKAECIDKTETKVIDIYDVLEGHGVYCKREFYLLDYAEEDFENDV